MEGEFDGFQGGFGNSAIERRCGPGELDVNSGRFSSSQAGGYEYTAPRIINTFPILVPRQPGFYSALLGTSERFLFSNITTVRSQMLRTVLSEDFGVHGGLSRRVGGLVSAGLEGFRAV